jgi:hypothetical protein
MARARKELHDAMWSVQFFTAGLRPAAMPRNLRPVPLRRAMDILADDWDEHDVPRRRRMLMELAGAGASKLKDHKTRASLSRLAQGAQVDQRVFDIIHPPEARRTLGDHLMRSHALAQDCIPVQHESSQVEYDPELRRTTVTATVLLKRPVSMLARVLDPQNWMHCSEFFEASFRVEEPDYRTPAPKERDGEKWDGLLYEKFKTPVATFENVLGINYQVSPREIRLDYWLYDSLSFSFFGQTRPGVLEVDDGYMSARGTRDPDVTELVVQKSLVYADLTPYDPGEGIDDGQWLNYTAPAMLSLWVDDSTHARMCCKF